MSTYMLGSLSNHDYDDYVKQHMNRLDHRANSFRTILSRAATRNQHDHILCDDPYCSQYQPSSSSIQRRSSGNGRRRSSSVHNADYHYPHQEQHHYHRQKQQPQYHHTSEYYDTHQQEVTYMVLIFLFGGTYILFLAVRKFVVF